MGNEKNVHARTKKEIHVSYDTTSRGISQVEIKQPQLITNYLAFEIC